MARHRGNGQPRQRQEARHQGYVDLKSGAVVENALCAIYTDLQVACADFTNVANNIYLADGATMKTTV